MEEFSAIDDEDQSKLDVATEILCAMIRHYGPAIDKKSQVKRAWEFTDLMYSEQEKRMK